MEPFKQIKIYCDSVCNQIRWKKARASVSREIENHLYDQIEAYIMEGDEEIVAVEKSIVQMGDPILVGVELDKTYKPKPQKIMILIVGILMLFGCVSNFYLSTQLNYNIRFRLSSYIMAFLIFLICYFIDFTILGKFPRMISVGVFLLSIIMLVLNPTAINDKNVFIIRVGTIGSVQLGYLYLIFPLAFILFVYSMKNKGILGIVFSGLVYFAFSKVLLSIPIFSGFLIYSIVTLIVLCFVICRGWFNVNRKVGLSIVIIPAFILSIISKVVFLSSSFRGQRFKTMLNPQDYVDSTGFIYSIIRECLSGAKLFGQGDFSRSEEYIQVLLNSDYALMYLIYKFGLWVLIVVISLTLAFSIMAIKKALKEKSMLGSLVALTIILIFILQVVFYILSNLYGVTASFDLPFIFSGRTSLYINSMLIGFMLSVFRTGEVYNDYFEIIKDKKIGKVFIYDNGKLIINFK